MSGQGQGMGGGYGAQGYGQSMGGYGGQPQQAMGFMQSQQSPMGYGGNPFSSMGGPSGMYNPNTARFAQQRAQQMPMGSTGFVQSNFNPNQNAYANAQGRPFNPSMQMGGAQGNVAPSGPMANNWTAPSAQQVLGGSPVRAEAAPATQAPQAGVQPFRPASDMAPAGATPGATPGQPYPPGYQFESAPNTTDPGSMSGLFGFFGAGPNGSVQQQAQNYANWYGSQYGQQAPGGGTNYYGGYNAPRMY